MSWRVLIIFLLLAAVASWQGGLQLGEWLVARAPDSIASASSPRSSTEQTLDSNGKPFTAQPPQPRIDGTLGVPRESAPVEWTIATVIAEQFDADPNAMKIDAEGNYERQDHELAAGGADLLMGNHDIATLDVANPTQEPPTYSSAQAGVTRAAGVSQDNKSVMVSSAVSPAAAAYAWQQALKKDIEQCNSVGFFQRPSCVQNARNKFCSPNNAWGKTADCPARSFDQTGGN